MTKILTDLKSSLQVKAIRMMYVLRILPLSDLIRPECRSWTSILDTLKLAPDSLYILSTEGRKTFRTVHLHLTVFSCA